MFGCDLLCRHTVTEESIIQIKYPLLDTNKFFDFKSFKELPSKLKSHISNNKKDDDGSLEDFSISFEEIDEALKRADSLFSSSDSKLISNELERIIKDASKEALELGLKIVQLDDFIKFYLINYMLNGNSIDYLESNKDYLLGRYFGINKIH